MALLYDPGIFMPRTISDFAGASWLVGWSDGVWCIHDVDPGGTVYLVDVATQRIVWHTEVLQSFAVPYEASAALAGEVARRWGLNVDVDDLPIGGYCVGWRAAPVARLDRSLAPDNNETLRHPDCGPADATDDVDDTGDTEFRLDGFQFTADLSPRFLQRWGLAPHEAHWCTGRPRLGWFGA